MRLAGFDKDEQYFIPRAAEEPPEELKKKIFPWLEAAKQQVKEYYDNVDDKKEKDSMTWEFFKMLEYFRVVILQDLGFILQKAPNCIYGKHPIASDPMFKEYFERLTVAVSPRSYADNLKETGGELLSILSSGVCKQYSKIIDLFDPLYSIMSMFERLREDTRIRELKRDEETRIRELKRDEETRIRELKRDEGAKKLLEEMQKLRDQLLGRQEIGSSTLVPPSSAEFPGEQPGEPSTTSEKPLENQKRKRGRPKGSTKRAGDKKVESSHTDASEGGNNDVTADTDVQNQAELNVAAAPPPVKKQKTCAFSEHELRAVPKMSLTVTTVHELMKEWFEGTETLMSIKERDEKYGCNWRREKKHHSFYGKRKPASVFMIQLVDLDNSPFKGYNKGLLGSLLDEFRKEKKLTLRLFCLLLPNKSFRNEATEWLKSHIT